MSRSAVAEKVAGVSNATRSAQLVLDERINPDKSPLDDRLQGYRAAISEWELDDEKLASLRSSRDKAAGELSDGRMEAQTTFERAVTTESLSEADLDNWIPAGNAHQASGEETRAAQHAAGAGRG